MGFARVAADGNDSGATNMAGSSDRGMRSVGGRCLTVCDRPPTHAILGARPPVPPARCRGIARYPGANAP
jgi:hypothetical protein